mmetsp:Transcript_21989/g.32477  ORF Transcript_21989/g.32477 Transcript_21989/m.32477 type:complete len:299 (-) Transcript_21989:77-973(-)
MFPCLVRTLCCGADADKLQNAGSKVGRLARETSGHCVETNTKSQQLIAFATDVKTTFVGFADGIDPSDFQNVQSLVSGDKMNSNIALAKEMDDLALQCVNKSMEMTKALKEGIEALPEPVKKEINDDNDEDSNTDQPDLPDIDKDIEELEECTKNIDNMNFFSAKEAGENAFEGLTNKGEVCQKVFGSMKDFADSIVEINDAFSNAKNCCGKIFTVVSEAKEIMRSIRLAKLIQLFAESAAKLIKSIIALMKAVMKKFKGLSPDSFKESIKGVADSVEGAISGVSSFMQSLVGDKGGG